MPIISPKFYLSKDKALSKFIFLDVGKHQNLRNTVISDKTQCEAFENHFHLFKNIGKSNKKKVAELGSCIAKNVLNALVRAYSDRKFIVYLEINVKGSTIIRFHQVWRGEPQYFNVSQFQTEEVQLFEFKN
jgi:hypothetical protein